MGANKFLDPLEQMIFDAFQGDTILKAVFGPYFEFVDETQGIPYVLVKEAGGGPNSFTMPGLGGRSMIEQPDRTFIICHSDKSMVMGLEQAIDSLFEVVGNRPLKDGSVCLSSMPLLTPWRRTRPPKDPTGAYTNTWVSRRWFTFRIESITKGA